LKAVIGMIPRRRIGEPDDIVGATIYLASRAASFVTGAVIPVAGGMTL
jgi:NAD(P)-dependent dehydrogenase (short-subunit alcohol dehydrogenase family)